MTIVAENISDTLSKAADKASQTLTSAINRGSFMQLLISFHSESMEFVYLRSKF